MSGKTTYKILIVDDNSEDRNTISRYLYQDDRYNYQILEAELVSQALEICDRTLPDLILLDYLLPDGDGLEFLQEWQRRYGNSPIPIILLTGQGDEKIAIEALKSGAQDYWVKGSLTAANIQQRVYTVLQQFQLKQQIARQQEQQSLVNTIALRIRQSLRLEEVLQRTVEEVRQFLHTDRVLIYKFAPDKSGTMVVESVLPTYTACLNLPIVDTCFRDKYVEKYRQGRFFIASDIYQAGIAECHIELLERFQVKANLVVPLLLNSRSTPELIYPISESETEYDLWGLLIAHQCDRPRQWQDYDLELLQQLAVQLAIAIQQAEMYERVQAELYARIDAQLRERQRVAAEFRALVENATDIIMRFDRDLRYLYFNPAIEKVIQQPASSLIGKTPQDLGINPEIIALWRATIDRIIVTKLEATIEYPFPDLESKIWFQTRIVPELNQTGEVHTFLCIARDISDRKQNEATLQLQAEILNQIHDGVISTDINGIIQSWNQGAEKLHGYTAAEAIGQPITMLCFPEEADQIKSLVFPTLLEQGNHEVEVRNRTKSGAEILVSLRLSLIRDEQGNIIRLIGCSNNITDRKRNEEILQLQAEILNQIHDAVISTDLNGIIQTWNYGAEKIFGYTAAEIIGQNVRILYQDSNELETTVIPPLIAKGSHELEVLVCSKSGAEIYASLRLSVIRDQEGNIIRLIGCSNDISDRKRNEETLRFQAEILDRIHDAVVVTNLEGKICSWNQGAENLYGYTTAETIGQSISILYFPEDLPQSQSEIFQVLLAKGSHEVELRNFTKSRKEIYISLRLSVIRDEQGNIINLIGCSNDITDRKKAEQELQQLNLELEARVEKRTAQLQQSQRFIENITDNAPNIIYIYDLEEQRNIYCNREVVSILGYSPEQILSMGDSFISNLIHPDDLQKLWIHFNNLEKLKNGEKWDNEYRLRDRNGEWRWFLSQDAAFLRDKDGKVKQIIGTAQDITERKQIEEQLRKSETNLRIAQRIAGLGSWEFDLKTGDIVWSTEIFTIFGRNPAIGTPTYEELQQIIHPEDRDRHNQAVQQAIEQGEPFDIEYRFYRPDGTMRYLQGRGEPVFNLDAQVVQLVGTALDITERKQYESKLSHLSERLSLAIKSGKFGIWEWDIVQDKLIWDGRMYELYGLQQSDSLEPYQTWANRLHPDDREQAETAIQQALRGEREFTPEFRVVHPDGSIRYIKAYALVQRNERAEPQRMVGVNFDITSSKQAEEKLRQVNERLTLSNAELHRATKLKDEFLANMSHELRTPLNSILGMAEGLQDGIFGNLTDRQKQAVNNIDRSGNHLLALINDVLDLAKVESGKLELQLAPTSITYLCRNSLTFVRQQAIKKNIQLTTEIPSNLPDIVVDELRIRQVLINLLNNAVKFTPDGGSIKLVVQPVGTPNQSLLHFSVVDTGIGMTQEDVAKLFQPFVQIDSRLNRQYSGTGLGLALVRRLVELHHGKVLVTSEVGQGSCFTVCLPYILSEATTVQPSISQPERSENEQLQPPEQTPNSTISQTEASASTILLVEDNEFNIATISSYLGSKGYKLLIAKNGKDGVRLAKSEHPDLILMDIQLPTVDGLEAISQIRADQELANIPIIALTALAMPGDREKCLVAGANDYMSKPLKLKQLVENIQVLLKKG